MVNCSVQPSDALPPGMTTVRPTASTPSSVSPTTIREWQFFVLTVLMTLFLKCFIKNILIIKLKFMQRHQLMSPNPHEAFSLQIT